MAERPIALSNKCLAMAARLVFAFAWKSDNYCRNPKEKKNTKNRKFNAPVCDSFRIATIIRNLLHGVLEWRNHTIFAMLLVSNEINGFSIWTHIVYIYFYLVHAISIEEVLIKLKRMLQKCATQL